VKEDGTKIDKGVCRQWNLEFRAAKCLLTDLCFKDFSHNVIDNIAFNSLTPELNPICQLLTLLETHHILHVSRIRVKYTCTSVTELTILSSAAGLALIIYFHIIS